MLNKVKYLIAKGFKILLNPPAIKNCQIDKRAKVCSRSELSTVKMGRYSYIGNMCFLVNAEIGAFCSIADRCCVGGAAHPIDRVSSSPVFHKGSNILKTNFAELPKIKTPKTRIENDVWIGMGCYIKAGVTIHNGAVIGMGSVVTNDIPAYEIWAGNPARKIKDRFEPEIKEKLLDSEWWEWEEKRISEMGDLFENPIEFVERYKKDENAI